MEAARKTARDHISRILRSVSHHITFLRHFVFVVLFLSTLRLQDGKINIVMIQREKKTQREATLRFFFLNAGTGLYHSSLFFHFYPPFSFFCFASISFYLIPSSSSASFQFFHSFFFFFFFLSDFKVFRISFSLRNLILLGLAVSRMHADTSGTPSLSLSLSFSLWWNKTGSWYFERCSLLSDHSFAFCVAWRSNWILAAGKDAFQIVESSRFKKMFVIWKRWKNVSYTYVE